MSAIVIVDSSVLLNILDVPGRNQSRTVVFDQLAILIEQDDHLFIPMAAIVEVGNHIAHVKNGAERRAAAQRFVKEVKSAMNDEAPWKPINFPLNVQMLRWLDAFPESATRGVGLGDLSILQEWESLCNQYAMSRVWIWSLDDDLSGRDRPANLRAH